MEELLRILSDIRPDVDFENATKLIDDSILDSFDIITIVSELDDAYGIDIEVSELEPENFNTAAAMMDLIKKLQEEG